MIKETKSTLINTLASRQDLIRVKLLLYLSQRNLAKDALSSRYREIGSPDLDYDYMQTFSNKTYILVTLLLIFPILARDADFQDNINQLNIIFWSLLQITLGYRTVGRLTEKISL